MDRDEIAARLKLAADDLHDAYSSLFDAADVLLEAENQHAESKHKLEGALFAVLVEYKDNAKYLGPNEDARKASVAFKCALERNELAEAEETLRIARHAHALAENAVRLSREQAGIARSLASLVAGDGEEN